jgi:hypothetical protein
MAKQAQTSHRLTISIPDIVDGLHSISHIEPPDIAYVTHCLKFYPKLIHFLHLVGETDEISSDLTPEAELDQKRCIAIALLKELGEL